MQLNQTSSFLFHTKLLKGAVSRSADRLLMFSEYLSVLCALKQNPVFIHSPGSVDWATQHDCSQSATGGVHDHAITINQVITC